jgi:hypothetical protein
MRVTRRVGRESEHASLRRWPAVLLALTLALPIGAAGQTPSPPPAQFRIGTAVVLLDVLVNDKSGRAVRDVSRDEVLVFENGELCEISPFRRVEVSPPTCGRAIRCRSICRSGRQPPELGNCFARLRPTGDRRPGRGDEGRRVCRRIRRAGLASRSRSYRWPDARRRAGFTTNAEAVADGSPGSRVRHARRANEGSAPLRARPTRQPEARAPAVDLGDASRHRANEWCLIRATSASATR